MRLEQEMIDSLLKELKQNNIDELAGSTQYKELNSYLMKISSNPLLIDPTGVMIVRHINTIRGFVDEPKGIEGSAFKFVADTNMHITALDEKIRSAIGSCKDEKELFNVLLMMMMLEQTLKKM
ncbi:MAG: hypothetical protein PHW52_03585 [Candidatus Pacebacteria bacterium]|nr:hypothetical protein [Candidatus Paceibacterota bacterium]